jgi:hypothetical protein
LFDAAIVWRTCWTTKVKAVNSPRTRELVIVLWRPLPPPLGRPVAVLCSLCLETRFVCGTLKTNQKNDLCKFGKSASTIYSYIKFRCPSIQYLFDCFNHEYKVSPALSDTEKEIGVDDTNHPRTKLLLKRLFICRKYLYDCIHAGCHPKWDEVLNRIDQVMSWNMRNMRLRSNMVQFIKY